MSVSKRNVQTTRAQVRSKIGFRPLYARQSEANSDEASLSLPVTFRYQFFVAGTLQYFADVQSARLALGHDRQGRIIVVEVDGKTGDSG